MSTVQEKPEKPALADQSSNPYGNMPGAKTDKTEPPFRPAVGDTVGYWQRYSDKIDPTKPDFSAEVVRVGLETISLLLRGTTREIQSIYHIGHPRLQTSQSARERGCWDISPSLRKQLELEKQLRVLEGRVHDLEAAGRKAAGK